MSQSGLQRRHFLAGATAGACALGFDVVHRTWVAEAHAASGDASIASIPGLDGELLLDQASRDAASSDFGYLVTRTPLAVLRPGSIDDVVKVICFANRLGIKVAGRGAAHSTFGQALALGGVVIDTSTLRAIHEVGPAGALVDAGALWLDVLSASLAAGLTPPVFTDYVETSVGGTLAVGGIGGATHRAGLQVDNVLALEVVTGEGQRLVCSPTQHAGLFQSVLGGLGQFAVVVRARLRLVPAPSSARVYRIRYHDLAAFTADQTLAALAQRFGYLEGSVELAPDGGQSFVLEAVAFYTPPDAPDDAALLDGLTFDPADRSTEETTYPDWINRLAPQVEFLKAVGAWFLPHPWFNVFLPASAVNAYVGGVLAGLTPADTGGGPVLLYPFLRSKLSRPFVRVPNEEVVFLFSILRFQPPELADAYVAENRALFEEARAQGGHQYPIGSIPFSPADWVAHYGPLWLPFFLQKVRFDPRRTLAPGQGIFNDPDTPWGRLEGE